MSTDPGKQAHDEGAQAFGEGKQINQNPYPHDEHNWWRNEEWAKGWEAAQFNASWDDYDDDD